VTLKSERSEADRAEGRTLFELLTALLQRVSDGQLVAACATGLAGVAVIVLLRPSWWRLALPLIVLGAFGAWGIAERERNARGARRVAAALVRVVAILAAGAAAFATVIAVMSVALGTWIS
jgi:hypothetical protein